MFDVLLSKYLDGSLTPAEDVELRNLLSENQTAKEQFNLAVSLHIAMNDVEDIPDLDELILESEAQIFEKLNLDRTVKSAPVNPIVSTSDIVTDPNFTKGTLRKAKRNSLLLKRVTAICCIFLLFVGNFSDSYLRYDGLLSSVDVVSEVDSKSEFAGILTEKTHSQYRTTRSSKSVESSLNSAVSAEESVSDLTLAAVNTEQPATNIEEKNKPHYLPFSSAIALLNKPIQSLNAKELLISDQTNFDNSKQTSFVNSPTTDLTDNQVKVVSTQNTNGLSPEGAKQSMVYNTSDESSEEKGKLHIGSFLNNGYVFSDNNKTSASSFSQSIGYGVTTNTKIGLEMGRVGYSYTQTNLSGFVESGATISSSKAATSSGKNMSSVLGKEDNTPVIEPKNGNKGGNGSTTQDFSVVWGGAYLEQSLINNSDFEINIRGGIGVAGEGAVLFARTYAEYKLSSFVSLSLGGEGKNFTIRNSSRTEKQLSSNYMIGLVYGVQIKL